MIVDDSSMIRRSLRGMLEGMSGIEVAGEAVDPVEAKDLILKLRPDVMILDIHLPKLDGISFLKIVMERWPISVIILSSAAGIGSEHLKHAKELGAAAILEKPRTVMEVEMLASRLPAIIQSAGIQPGKGHEVVGGPGLILIGSSSGGTEAVDFILRTLPINTPPIVIVQHIPEEYCRSFTDRLNRHSSLDVNIAAHNEIIGMGMARIAPTGVHTEISFNKLHFRTKLCKGPKQNYHCPSIDRLFQSAANPGCKETVGILLSGMGKDGAQGMLDLKNAGAVTMIQNKETCPIYGIPRAAEEMGGVNEILPLCEIPEKIRNIFHPSYRIKTKKGATT